MPYHFKHAGQHSCEAVVLSCIDFRFWSAIVEHIQNELKITDFDFPSLPGAAKTINNSHNDSADLALSCIDVPVRLHGVQKIIIINHADCGAYGGRAHFNHDQLAELAFHSAELQAARVKLSAKYPDKEVITLFVQFNPEAETIDILTIN
jgi:carbonic anhydrase